MLIVYSLVLLLAATLTATDTVSVLSILDKIRYPRVHAIIFGEGAINDAVAIIFFKVASENASKHSQLKLVNPDGLLSLAFKFIIVSIISISIGFGLSALLSMIFDLPGTLRQSQTSLIIGFCFFGYYLSESLGCSGIASLITFIVSLNHLFKSSVSNESWTRLKIIFEFISPLAEKLSFFYLGFESIQLLYLKDLSSNISLCFFLFIGLGVIRWLAIGMPAFLLVCYERIEVEIKEIVLIWYSGLIRGSISVALTLSFTHENKRLRTVILMVSFFSSIILSSLSKMFTKKLGFGIDNNFEKLERVRTKSLSPNKEISSENLLTIDNRSTADQL